jgi:hypothetical protein
VVVLAAQEALPAVVVEDSKQVFQSVELGSWRFTDLERMIGIGSWFTNNADRE